MGVAKAIQKEEKIKTYNNWVKRIVLARCVGPTV